MIEELTADMIGTYGFPVFVCLWFMFRTEKIIKANTEAIINLSSLMKGGGKNGKK